MLLLSPFFYMGAKFGPLESRTSWRETKKMQIKLATTCTKNEQQQDFDVLLTVNLSVILVINQLNAQNLVL